MCVLDIQSSREIIGVIERERERESMLDIQSSREIIGVIERKREREKERERDRQG